MYWKEPYNTERKTVLKSQMFLRESIYGKIKGQTVADENKQRSYISKEDSNSQTVST